MQTKRTTLPNKLLPYLLLAPQILITLVFFIWPAGQAIWTSFLREDPFGFRSTFVWFEGLASAPTALWILIGFVLAALSLDGVDGYLARRFRQRRLAHMAVSHRRRWPRLVLLNRGCRSLVSIQRQRDLATAEQTQQTSPPRARCPASPTRRDSNRRVMVIP